MDVTEAEALLAAVGTDNAPTIDQVRDVRASFVAAAKLAKEKADKLALGAMLGRIKDVDIVLAAMQAEADTAQKEIDELAAELPELADEPAEVPAEPVKEPARVLSVAEAAARLGLAKTPEPQVQVMERPTQTLTLNGEDVTDATWRDMGQAFAKAFKSNRRVGRNTIASFSTPHDLTVKGLGDTAATRVFEDMWRRAADPAVVAAGGCCTLAEPLRDQPMLSSTARPLADSIPTVGASAGAVAFFPPVCLPQGFANPWTCDDDAAVDPADDTTWKNCISIDCADPDQVTVEAIYQCLTIGNFQQKFNPERWDAYLAAAAAEQARVAEQQLFAGVAAQSTTHTVTDTGSVYATFLRTVLTAAATIRQNQRYLGQRIEVWAASWLQDAINMDVLARAIRRGRTIENQSVETVLGAQNIDVVLSPDIDPIEPDGQSDGALTEFPDTASILLFVDGGVFRLDGGELNLGTEIRDVDNNRQNQVSAFAESFESPLVRSCDSKVVTVPVTICDLVPCDDTPAAV